MTITNGQELSDWLHDDGAYDYYEEEIIAGYVSGCLHCSRWNGDDEDYDEYDDDIDEYASENDISLEDCNGPDDLDYPTFREYEDTIDPLREFVDAHIEECTQHINDKTIHTFLENNVKIGDDGSDGYFDHILCRIDNLI